MVDFYRIGVALSLTSNAPQVLQAIARDMLYLHTHVGNLQSAFSRLGLAIGGAFAVFTGSAALRGVEHLIDKTKTYYDELARLRNLGISTAQLEQIRGTAWSTMQQTRGVSLEEMMKIAGAGYSLTRNVTETQALMGPIARFMAQAQLYTKPGGQDPLQLLRASDLLARFTDPKTKDFDATRFGNFLNLFAQGMQGTHGAFDIRAALGLGQQMGAVSQGLSDKGLVTMMIYSQLMGPQRAGTAFTSMIQQFSGGQQMRRAQVEELIAEGILHPEDVVGGAAGRGGRALRPRGFPRGYGAATESARGGGFGGVMITPEARRRLNDQFGRDPLSGIEMQIKRLEEMGVTDPADIAQHLMAAYGRQTTQRFAALGGRGVFQMERERRGIMGGAGTEGGYFNAEEYSVTKTLNDLSAAWKTLLDVVAGERSPFYLGYLKTLADYLRDFGFYLHTVDPEILQGLGKAFIVLGASLVGAGAVAILAAIGPAGWLVLGLGALASTLTKEDWKVVMKDATIAIAEIGKAVQWLAGALKWVADHLPGRSWQQWDEDMRRPGGHDGATVFRRGVPIPTPSIQGPSFQTPGGAIMVPPHTGKRSDLEGGGGFTPASLTYGAAASYSGPSITGPKVPLAGVGSPGGITIPPGASIPRFGGGGANYMTGALPGGGDLTRVHTAGGAITAYGPAAGDMGGFVDDLVAAGAPIHSIGSYNRRHIAGSNRWSQHAYGTALDIEQSARNVVSPAFLRWAKSHPQELAAAMQRRHMLSGGDWKHPDFGHFEWGGPSDTGFAKGSKAIPPHHNKPVDKDTHVFLDGRKISHNMIRQFADSMGGMAAGSRTADYTSARPQAVAIAIMILGSLLVQLLMTAGVNLVV